MKKLTIIIAAIIVVAGLVYFVLNKNNPESKPEDINRPSLGSTAAPRSAEFPPSESNPPATLPASTSNPTPVSRPASIPVTHSAVIQNFSFNRSSVIIKKGDTVIWANKDSAPHTVTGDNGGPSSPTISANGNYSFTFDSAGTFGYHCSFHPSMKGTVVVTP